MSCGCRAVLYSKQYSIEVTGLLTLHSVQIRLSFLKLQVRVSLSDKAASMWKGFGAK